MSSKPRNRIPEMKSQPTPSCSLRSIAVSFRNSNEPQTPGMHVRDSPQEHIRHDPHIRMMQRYRHSSPASDSVMPGFIASLMLIFIVTLPAFAQKGDRTAILDAARARFERSIGGKLIFKVATLKQKGDWAFLVARPLRPGNKSIDWSRTPFADAWREGVFDEEVIALLKRSGGRWRVVEGVIGATDVPYGCWWKKHHAPKSIFTYTEADCEWEE